MSTVPIGVQLSIELTRIFGAPIALRAAQSAYDAVITLARTLRKSGSDLLVEADLADIFGRGKIQPDLERRFRTTVLQEARIVPIHHGSVMSLSTGPGPTVSRSAPPSEQPLMASVIQLSFLGWMYERSDLASSLAECLDKRFEMGISPNPSPGFDGIASVLEACSSQTSEFNWSEYREAVRSRLVSTFTGLRSEADLPTSMLLACLDCLYIVQRTPEDRLITISNSAGMEPLIIWAHHILGLSVLVREVDGPLEILFSNGTSAPSVFIDIKQDFNPIIDHSICLLDKNFEVVLTIAPNSVESETIAPLIFQERLKLRGYGTIAICRWLGKSIDTFLREPAYPALVEAVELTIAMARLASQRLYHAVELGPSATNRTWEDRLQLERWRIYDAAMIMFADPFSSDDNSRIPYQEASVESFLKIMETARTWDDIPAPPALQQLGSQLEESSFKPLPIVATAVNLLCFATVEGIRDCADLTILKPRYDYCDEDDTFAARILSMDGDIPMKPFDVFLHICRLLSGRSYDKGRFHENSHSEDNNCIMLSDFGWTTSLPTYGDSDPFGIIPGSAYIRRGVPMNAKTMERKSRVRDAAAPVSLGYERLAGNVVYDRGEGTYRPRCVSPVYKRDEYYGSKKDGFYLMTKFYGEHTTHGLRVPEYQYGNAYSEQGYSFQVWQTCRGLHEGLWNTITAPPCQHKQGQGGRNYAKLGLGVATVPGTWAGEGVSPSQDYPA